MKSEGGTALRGEGEEAVVVARYSPAQEWPLVGTVEPLTSRGWRYGIQGALAKPRSSLLQQECMYTAFTLIVAPPHTTADEPTIGGCGTRREMR